MPLSLQLELHVLFYNGAHQTEDELKVQVTKLRSI